ncbi:MAG: NAD(+)/NADH kinase [Desulfovibrio sp.]|uniref:NAD(+)/NADH kinase n=1 Tax=Desulfovibrio sp. TaxID=885 RepID=UPI0025BC6356|nr:NAD(+)/NADH kinase [Desulfovibrio sp.]MBS6829592.1 NAD(+)/NADH kinase [Desulfovibrio sp.]
MQNTVFRHVLLVCKARHERAWELGCEILQWLRAQGHTAVMIEAGHEDAAYAAELDFVVVLGGDGTMLGVARRMVGRAVPLFGINFGRVGFLTDAQPEHWEERLLACLKGELAVRTCLALSWKLTRGGSPQAGGSAVNDVVLSRGSLSRLVCVNIAVDGQRMGLLRSDGIILSTPVGSSGYSVSAGGPLLYPGMNAVAFTPICPFLNTISPMVFPGKTVFSMRIEAGSTDCYITVDGQEGQRLEIGDLVEVTGLPAAVRFMGDEISFFERLRTRGFVLERASGADAEKA